MKLFVNRSHHLSITLCSFLLLLVTACGTPATVSVVGPVKTPTSTPIPTNTPISSCATLVPGSSLAGLLPNFPDVGLPTGSVISAPKIANGGAGQFTITEYDACFSRTINQIQGPFSAHISMYAQLLGRG